MAHPAADLNLLLGILALQMDFINRDQLIAAMHAWVLDKSKSLGDVLVAQGVLAPKRLTLLESLVEEHLHQHGNDAGRSLAAVGASGVAQAALAQVDDSSVRETLSILLGEPSACLEPGAEKTTAYQPVTVLGLRYRALRPHAQGGLGEVFVARDEELHREVALKQILRRFAHDPVSRARFVLEAEVTGNLEHPGVVPVYGFGQYEDGRPYYAMRFVQGESLRAAIRHYHRTEQAGTGHGSLAFRKLLASFVAVCQTIHYAHSRGVLHRDLKPDNVMLGRYGETLVVDWGLAKPLDRPTADAERSLADQLLRPASSGEPQTITGSALGTPAYMSPEQAAGRLDQLTTATDIYSLGATLYCLLTDRAPFEGETAEVLPRVQEGEFPPPRAVNRHVPAALEAICLRAMALRPRERYRSARDLAEDVEHWLADEPVTACQEPALVRLARWGRRHRPLVSGAAALLLTTLVALGIGLVLLGQARARTEQQRQQAEANFLEAQRQRDLARANFQMARRAVDESFVQISENTLLQSNLPGLHPLRKQLLESALKYYQQFVDQSGDDAALQAELAQAYLRVGYITHEIGQPGDGADAFLKALGLYQALSRSYPENASYRGGLADAYRCVAWTKIRTEEWAQAIDLLEQAIRLGEQLVQSYPEVLEYQYNLARSYLNLGLVHLVNYQAVAGRRPFRQSIRTWERLIEKQPRPEYRKLLAETYSDLGVVYLLGGQLTPAAKATEKAVDVYRRLVNDSGAAPDFEMGLAFALDNLGLVYYYSRQPDKAVQASQEAADIAERVARENSTVDHFLNRAILNQIDLGQALLAVGRHAEAQRAYERALELTRKHQHLPDPPKYFSFVSIYHGMAKVLNRQGQTGAARAALQQAIQIGKTKPGGEKPFTTYELACSQALWSTWTGERHVADDAMKTLAQAVAEGWENLSWIRNDPDLAALHNLPAFEQLVQDLEKRAKAETDEP